MKALHTFLVLLLPFYLKAQLQVLPDHTESLKTHVVPFYDMSIGRIHTFRFNGSTYVALNAGIKQRPENGGGHGGLVQLFISNFTTLGLMYRYTYYKDRKSTWYVSGGLQKSNDIYNVALEGAYYISQGVSFQGGVRYFPFSGDGLVHQVYGGLGLHRGAAAAGTGALAIISVAIIAAVIGRSQ